jgi:hypothetical protein
MGSSPGLDGPDARALGARGSVGDRVEEEALESHQGDVATCNFEILVTHSGENRSDHLEPEAAVEGSSSGSSSGSSGAGVDSGSESDAAPDGGAVVPVEQNIGCGCRVAGSSETDPAGGLKGFVLIAMLVFVVQHLREMGPHWGLAVVAAGACTLLVACTGLVAPEAAPAADGGLETGSPPPATDAMSPLDAASEPAPRDAPSREVLGFCAGSSCADAKLCAEDIAYSLDDGSGYPGVHGFTREQDAVAYARSLGFQGPLTGNPVEFAAGGDPYVFAQLFAGTVFTVVDGTVAPDAYSGVVLYVQCTDSQDASADAEDAATE